MKQRVDRIYHPLMRILFVLLPSDYSTGDEMRTGICPFLGSVLVLICRLLGYGRYLRTFI